MNKILTFSHAHARMGVKLALLAVFGFTLVSRADVAILDTTGTTFTQNTDTGAPGTFGEIFNVGSIGGQISSVVLGLNFSAAGSLEVDLYNANGGLGGLPTTFVGSLGTITSSGANHALFTLSGGDLTSFNLVAGSYYAIQITTVDSTIGWDYNNGTPNDGNTGSGTFTGGYYNGSPNSGIQGSLALQVVPEISVTGLAMGMGALGIGVVHTFRRKALRLQLRHNG